MTALPRSSVVEHRPVKPAVAGSISRRGFLRTLGAAVAVGFAKVETAVVDNLAVDWGLETGDWTTVVRWCVDPHCPPNTIYFLSKDRIFALTDENGWYSTIEVGRGGVGRLDGVKS